MASCSRLFSQKTVTINCFDSKNLTEKILQIFQGSKIDLKAIVQSQLSDFD